MLSSRFSSRHLVLSAVLSASVVVLAACGGQSSPNDSGGSSVSGTETSTVESTASSRASASGTTSKDAKSVAEAQKTFGSLAPEPLFQQFESCMPNGVADSVACSGLKVGQFQFFANESKAASTTQLLTELRGSRIVEDKGDRIVGWSTLGNTAIVTVVDNNKGLVMQQMISTDKQDPRKRIHELGLTESKESESTSESGTSTSAEPEASEESKASAEPTSK